MQVIRCVNRLYVDNLGPSGIGETPSKFQLCFIFDQRGFGCVEINHEIMI
jgi:hypothetical protein